MTRYEGESSRLRLRSVIPLLLAIVVGLLIGRGTASGGEDSAPSTPGSDRSGGAAENAHDRGGAALAAASLSRALAYAIAAGPDRVQQVAAEVGTSRYAARVGAAYQGRRILDPAAGVLFRAVPISYRVLSYSQDQAAVRIWSASILAGDDASPGAASFKTATIVVRWANGEWRVDDVRDPTAGPTPRTGQPSAGARFITELTDTETFNVQP